MRSSIFPTDLHMNGHSRLLRIQRASGALRVLRGLFAPMLLAPVIACGPAPAPPAADALQGRLGLTGSSTVAPLAAEIAKRFEAQHPEVRIDVQTGGSSRGIADARSGIADIGLVSRALVGTEQSDLQAHPIARDGIAMIVHASNPVPQLNADQVRALYRGQWRNWQQAGGPDLEVSVVNKAQGRSTLDLFLEHFGLQSREIRPAVVIGDNEQGIKTVAGNAGAIGYVSVGSAEYAAASGVPIRLLALDAIQASVDSVRQQRYPLARPLNLVTRGTPGGLAAAFIAYAQSPAVHDLVRGLYFVPLE